MKGVQIKRQATENARQQTSLAVVVCSQTVQVQTTLNGYVIVAIPIVLELFGIQKIIYTGLII